MIASIRSRSGAAPRQYKVHNTFILQIHRLHLRQLLEELLSVQPPLPHDSTLPRVACRTRVPARGVDVQAYELGLIPDVGGGDDRP